ncbi:MAG TPA: hypothetical protein VFK52_08580 [Nocardioidaceae bacterium]|nr:hypothetical protein [Nocardioidaceae bacterium]
MNTTTSSNRLALQTLALAAALVVSSCGGDSSADGPATTPEPQDLTAFLIQDNEEPGFRQEGAPETIEGVDDFAAEMRLTDEEAATLRELGFVSFTVTFISGPDDSAGVSNVQLFEDAAGAEEWMAHDVSDEVIKLALPDAKIERFTVDAIPGSTGWTSPAPGAPVANLLWVQGTCVFTLGNQGPGELVADITTGAEAIYRRTEGTCPEG